MTPYLLFSLDGARYGVDARSVLEIAWLPDLSPAEEAPRYIAGMVNLRGKIEPVMDLGQRLGHPPRRYQLGDSIVMLQTDGATMGVIVGDVSDVVGIAAAEIEPPPHYGEQHSAAASFLTGNAQVGEELIMLLNVSRLLHAPALPESGIPENLPNGFCPSASANDRAVFRARAHNLMQMAESEAAAERIPVSIIQLGEEYFGVELSAVREFSHLRRVTAIPCCPPHIAGNMNLRGDILTLVDIRGLLNIPANTSATEVMVVESGELSIGVPVDQVLEVIYLRPVDMLALKAAAYEEKNEYCKGVVRYGESMAGILDMQKILAEGGLAVEEEV
jgi:purine-binding chemotaxis protein CheW